MNNKLLIYIVVGCILYGIITITPIFGIDIWGSVFLIIFSLFVAIGLPLILMTWQGYRKLNEESNIGIKWIFGALGYFFLICFFIYLLPDTNKNDNSIAKNPQNKKEITSQPNDKWLLGTWKCKYWMESTPAYPGALVAPVIKYSTLVLREDGIAYFDNDKMKYKVENGEVILRESTAKDVSYILPIDYENKRIYFGNYKSDKFYYYKQ